MSSKKKLNKEENFRRFKHKRGLSGLRFYLGYGRRITVSKEPFIQDEIRCVKSFKSNVEHSHYINFYDGDSSILFESYEEFLKYTLTLKLAGID